jgi:hypothetical protein
MGAEASGNGVGWVEHLTLGTTWENPEVVLEVKTIQTRLERDRNRSFVILVVVNAVCRLEDADLGQSDAKRFQRCVASTVREVEVGVEPGHQEHDHGPDPRRSNIGERLGCRWWWVWGWELEPNLVVEHRNRLQRAISDGKSCM